MVQKSEKTAVPLLIPGLFDRSRSRTLDTLIMTRPVKTDFRNVVLRGKQSCCGYSKVPKPYGLCTKTMHFS